MTHVTDADLAARAATGESEAFTRLVERHSPSARRLARAALGDLADADDAVQEAWLSVWRHLAGFDLSRPFAPWFLRIVLNAATDLRRRRQVRRTEQIPANAPSAGVSPERATDRALLRDRLATALAELPERQRLAVVLFDAEGYPHAEISRMLGVPEGTVRSDVFHARRTLRGALAALEESSR